MPDTLIFEPHSLFRHEPIDGEEFPFGYLSKAPGQPIFALHESFGDVPVEELARIARLIAAAPDLLASLVEILGPLNVCTDNPNVRDDQVLPVDMTMGELRRARAAISKATSRQPEGER